MAHSITFLGTLSKAFSMSTKHIYSTTSCPSIDIFPHNKYCIHCFFPGINLYCILFKLIGVRICLLSTHSTIFIACSSSFAPLCGPQFITSLFSLKRNTITLVFHPKHSSTIQYAPTQVYHHFYPNFATRNYHRYTYFKWS